MLDLPAPIPGDQQVDRLYAQRLAAISEVSRAVTSSLELNTLLLTLVELLRQSLDYYAVNVWLLTEPAEAVQLKAGLTPQGEDLSLSEVQLAMGEENSITWVCQTGVHHLSNQLDPQTLPLGDRFPLAKSQLVLPLKIAQKHVGALEIISTQPSAFREEDIVLLRSLADQVTIAIRNATLYQAEQSRRRFAETLYQIGYALSSTIQLDEVLEQILRHLNEIVPSDRSAVVLREGGELEFVATRGFGGGPGRPHLRIPLHTDSIYARVFDTAQPVSIPDVLLHPEWRQMDNLPAARAWMGVPLIRSDQVLGMLYLAREAPNPYTYSEVTLARTFAGQAAIALENARLYDRLSRFNQKLEEMVQARTEELVQAYDQLERLDKTKSDFIKVTSHELRTPLTVLLGYSQMLLQDRTISEQERLAQLVDGIYSGAERLHDIVNTMLDIVKIDSRSLELSPEPLALGLLIRNIAGNFKNALRQREITLTIEDMSEVPPVEADNNALQKVFYQLISNAIKYTPDGGVIRLGGRACPPGEVIADDGIEITIQDSGIGIAPAQQELIFEKFYQTGEVALHSTSPIQFKGGGPGLGLSIARGIIQAHGGKLWVESPGYDEAACPGSTFHVVLPLRQKKPPAFDKLHT
jgi:signal transduction histidine kinase